MKHVSLFLLLVIALFGTLFVLAPTGARAAGDVTWATSTNALPAAFNDATSVITGHTIYIMGAYGDHGEIQTPYIGTIGNDGEVSWTTSANSLPGDGDYPTSVVSGNKIYYMGAANDGHETFGGDSDRLYIGTIGNDGDVTWTTGANPLPWDFSDASSVLYGGKIYVMGGGQCNGCHTDQVAIGTIGNDGDVTWATSANVLPAVSGFATSVVYGNKIYLMGGCNFGGDCGLDTVYIGTIGNDGEVSWTISAHTLPTVSGFATAVLDGKQIYVMGGLGAGSQVDINTVFIGTVGDDGDVTWATSESTVPQALDSADAEIYNGKIYFIGGENGNGNSASVYIGSVEVPVPPAPPAPGTPPSNGPIVGSYTGSLQTPLEYWTQLQTSIASTTILSSPSTPPVPPSAVSTATTSTTFVFSRNLQVGSTGSDVHALQTFLIFQSSGSSALRLKAHGTTQYFGALTFNALQEFQKKVGIVPASGFFGPITRAYVNGIKR